MSALAALASCAPTVDACAGWRPVRVADATARHMAANDPQALAGLIAHHEFGQRMGCWK
jgi:hypothetical protein